ncbi:MAG: hypothetical protein ACTS8S_00730 [Giesbergeria sp.]
MANLKISELAAGTLPMSGTELVPVVQGAATVYVPASALTPADVVRDDDPRLTDARTPTGGAGGVLSGSYPNPGFAVDMATQGELDAHTSNTTNPHITTAVQVGADPAGAAAAAVAAHAEALDPHPTYTTAAEAAAAAPVQSVAGRTGAVTLAKGDVSLGNVDNTSDASKPVSTAQAAAIATATAIHPFLLIGA